MAEIDYSQGWNWGEDAYKVKSRFKQYWYAFRNPVTSVLKYCRSRGIKLDKVAEIGCGGGSFGIRFVIHGLDVYFIDEAMDMLKACTYNLNRIIFFQKNKKIEGRLFCQDMFHLGFKDEQFDLVISDGVYEHLHEREARVKFINESRRVLKKGGCLFIAIPNNKRPLAAHWKKAGWCWLDEVNNPVYYEITLSPDELSNELGDAGFSDIYCDGFKLWDFICACPYTKFRRAVVYFLKAFVPEMTRGIRLKYANWLYVIGRKE